MGDTLSRVADLEIRLSASERRADALADLNAELTLQLARVRRPVLEGDAHNEAHITAVPKALATAAANRERLTMPQLHPQQHDDGGASASLGALGKLIAAVSQGRVWSYFVVGPMLVVLLFVLALVIAAPFGHAGEMIDATLGGVVRIVDALTTRTVEVEGAVTLDAGADSLFIDADSLDLP